MQHKKYPNSDLIISSFFAAVSESYNSPLPDEAVDGHKKQEIVAEEFEISRLKVRKILITTGDIKAPREIKAGKPIEELCAETGLSRSSVNSYLPYSKGVYKLSEVSAAAERTERYRERKGAVEEFNTNPTSLNLWKCIIAFQDYPFTTSGRGDKSGVKFKYTVSEPGKGGRQYEGETVEGYGNEIMIEGREKSISRSSVDYAFRISLEEEVKGPKQLRVFGSSYIYAIFRRFGLV